VYIIDVLHRYTTRQHIAMYSLIWFW